MGILQGPGPFDAGRRNILKFGAIAAAATAVVSATYLANMGRYSWDFLETRNLPSPSDMEEAYLQPGFKPILARLGSAQKFEIGSPGWAATVKAAEPRLSEMMASGVIGRDLGNYILLAGEEDFAVPDEARFAGSAESYGKRAMELLYSTIRGLDDRFSTPRWTPVEPGVDYSGRHDSRCFIGMGYYELRSLSVAGKDGSGKPPGSTHVATLPSFKYGSFTWREWRDHGPDMRSWFVFAPTNENALYAPFSEPVHLSASPATLRYLSEAGPENARVAEETMAEALSANLVRRAVPRLGAPYDLGLVGKKVASLAGNPVYSRVPEADRWVQRNGMQEAFDTYMESPGKFMKAISGD